MHVQPVRGLRKTHLLNGGGIKRPFEPCSAYTNAWEIEEGASKQQFPCLLTTGHRTLTNVSTSGGDRYLIICCKAETGMPSPKVVCSYNGTAAESLPR